jgi:early secretory antigenic target protein ESAT-6
MSDHIKVTFGALESASGNIKSASSKVDGELSDLKSQLQPLVSAWTGQAAETYNVLQKQWDTAATDLNMVLAQIGAAVASANEAYNQGERANTARFQA